MLAKLADGSYRHADSSRIHLIRVAGFNPLTYRMNGNAFRHFYDYHFAENRKVWDSYIAPLSDESSSRSLWTILMDLFEIRLFIS